MKVLYVTTLSRTMTFFPEHFKMLIAQGHTIEWACNMDDGIPENCKDFNFKTHHIPFSRSPLSAGNIKALKELKKLVKAGGYDIVHTHTPNASICTRIACRAQRKKGLQVFYTAHGFHFYKGAPLINWLVYFPAEWLCSFWTDKLITINREDYSRAKNKMHAKKTLYVPGVGLNLDKFSNATVTRSQKREELGVPEDGKLLVSVGELNQNKNHETVIKAIAGLDVYYLIAGIGEKKEELKALAKELNMSDRVRLLGFRTDVNELYIASDVFVFPSIREGLGVASAEAMASGLPCVVSKIRGSMDLIDETGGFLFEPHSVEECRTAIQNILNTDVSSFRKRNFEKVKEFSNEAVLQKMEKIYDIKG